MHALLHSVPPTLLQATADPHLCCRLLYTNGQVWVSLLLGSLLLSPGSWCTQGFVCALKESVSQSCVSSGSSMVGLMTTSSKRAYAIPRSAVPRAPSLQQCIADPYLHRWDSNSVLAWSLWGLCILVCTRFVWVSECLWQVWGLILNTVLPLLLSRWRFSLALGHGVSPQSCSINR